MARAARGKAPRPRPRPPRGLAASLRRLLAGAGAGAAGVGGLGVAAAAYVGVDYLRYLSPAWHGRLMPALWAALALAAAARAPFYRHWSAELRAALPFLGSIAFMLGAFLCEAVSVRFVSAVMGLQWHRVIFVTDSCFWSRQISSDYSSRKESMPLWNKGPSRSSLGKKAKRLSAAPLPDTGQWLLLALNEKLPQSVVDLLRAHVITLHHYLMLFIMLGFSVLFGCIKAPGLGIATRYMFTMAIGRLLRTITFVATILPSARPWCAAARYQIPGHPHPWAQKYYVPYASDSDAIRRVIRDDVAYAAVQSYPGEYRPDWGRMSFLVDILRPTPGEGPSWYHLLKKASGGCNDLMYSGHMLVAVLTAIAWTEAYGGWISVAIWLLVLHSAQREIRERHHYTVDCVVAIYVGILLWRMTRFIWSARDASRARRLAKLDEVQNRLIHAAKDSDVDEIRGGPDKMEMGMRARESVNMSEDLTQAIAPYATALHDASLWSHCSSCFRGLPAQSPHAMSCTTCGSVRYCCSDCLISDCEVHSFSGECCFFVNHLREASPSTLTEETSDVRAALRLLYSLEMCGLVSSDSVSSSNRISGLSASGIREVLEEGGEIAEGVLEGSLLMLSARKSRMKNYVGLFNGLTIEKVVLWAVMTNSVEVQISEEQSLGIAVYGPSFSWFNHSCCPNASYRFVLVPQNEGCTSNKPESCVVPVSKGAAPDAWHAWQNEEAGFAHAQCKYGPRVVVRCTKPINKGDEVFITYIDLLQTRIVKDCYRIGLVKVQGLRCDARNLKSPHNAVTDPAIEDLDNNLQQAISEYSFLDDSKACCDVIESMLSENLMNDLQQEELSPRKYILHPLHHISVSSFMILASAYRCSAFKSSTDNLHGENCDFIFRMTKAAAAYSIVLAGATHHLFLSECSFVTLLSHFLLSTGQSILDFAECIKGETRKNIPEAIFSFASCSTNSAKHDSVRYNQFRSTCEKFGRHLLSLSLQCWPFLAQGLPCLEKIKNPIDFSWLGPAIFQAFQLSEEDSFKLSGKHAPATLIEQQKECILSLAVCCITYSKYLASICYGPEHYLANRAKDLLECINHVQ
uniref:SET domain-containing protein n=1 Tax=Oryza meridionalis TaxID=40149 RepID=A0A0E0DE80_9ORYZ